VTFDAVIAGGPLKDYVSLKRGKLEAISLNIGKLEAEFLSDVYFCYNFTLLLI